MFSRETKPGLGRAGRVKPQLEALEDRCCPSTVWLNPHTHVLLLTGDASNSSVVVRDDGRGDVQVSGLAGASAAHPLKFTGVAGVTIDSKTGNDHIDYALTAALTKTETLTLNLGKGDDQVRLNFSKGVSAPKLTVNVNGVGGGNQDVTAVFGAIHGTDLRLAAALGGGLCHFNAAINGDLTGNANVHLGVTGGRGSDGINVRVHGQVAATAHLAIQTSAGANDSTLSVDYAGKLLGHLSIQEKDGAGWDWLESNVVLAPGSTGWLTDHLVEGEGIDMLLLQLQDRGSQLRGLDATITSSPFAVAAHTPNVKVVNSPV